MPAPSCSLEEDSRGLFGPIYTYDEWRAANEVEEQKQLDEKESRTSRVLGPSGAKPAHWPDDTEPDTAKWAFWLPEGWGQGLKQTSGGKMLKCYVGPPGSGKRLFHKPDIEKFLGYTLKTRDELPKEVSTKNCHDTLPHWPGNSAKSDDTDWLPHDWCIAYRQLPTTLHRVYLPPGQREGYLWHRACVEEWVGGNPKKMASFENSRKMEDIMVNGRVDDKGGDAPSLPKMNTKRKHGQAADTRRVVTDESYAKCLRLAACRVGGLEGSGCPAEAMADLRKQEEVLRELLRKRGFTDVDFMACFLRALEDKENDDEGARPYGKIVERLLGLFYNMSELNGRPCYHQLRMFEGESMCTGLYLYWSPHRKAWKFSSKIDDNAAGYAVFPCEEADKSANLMSGEGRSWKVLTQNFFALPEQKAGHPSAAA